MIRVAQAGRSPVCWREPQFILFADANEGEISIEKALTFLF
jgi:hypothetical protein